MEYRFLERPGALNEGRTEAADERAAALTPGGQVASMRPFRTKPVSAETPARAVRRDPSPLPDLDRETIPPEVIKLVPAAIARDHEVIPLAFDGERVTCAAVNPDDIALADRLRFLLAKDVRLVLAPKSAIRRALDRYYDMDQAQCADSMLQEVVGTAVDFTDTASPDHPAPSWRAAFGSGAPLRRQRFGALAQASHDRTSTSDQQYLMTRQGVHGMIFYTVPEGQQVLMTKRDGSMTILVGPRRVLSWLRTFQPMGHHVAHPGQFLVVRFRDGRQQHIPGPTVLWFDPRIHEAITTQEALQIGAKEAVVVYTQQSPDGEAIQPQIARRIVYGPALFVPEPGQWLHTFSWHASKGGSRGVEKIPNALVFQKLWLMPDQMYHDVHDVRTADDAVLTIRLMIFFELTDINLMLEATHDPIGDFVNAATADVVEFTGRHDFESFKQNTAALNDLATYKQLLSRAAQCGYKIGNVVYRGYGAAESLQQMHNQAIEARTKLQLDRATEQQAQELENYRLESQLGRASRRRAEQSEEVRHELELTREKNDADLKLRSQQQDFLRQQRAADSRLRVEMEQLAAQQQEAHLQALKQLGVDLTAYLTQGRADRVIELRGAGATHFHLDPADTVVADRDRQRSPNEATG